MIRNSGSEVKIGIVMPILNQQTLALEAYASMRSRFDLEFYPINNWIHKYSVAKSWNVGINKALNKGCGLIIVANDDIRVSKFAIDRMATAMYSNPNLALVTGHDVREHVGVDEIENYDPYPEASFYGDIHSVVTDYAFYMIRPRAYAEIGSFDQAFEPAYFEDNDYHRRIEVHPYWESYQLKTAAFYHYGSTTQNSGHIPVCSHIQFEKNRAFYIKKWGGVPGQEKFNAPFNGEVYGVTL